MAYKYDDEVTTTFGTIKTAQNSAFQEGVLAVVDWLNKNEQSEIATWVLQDLGGVKPYEEGSNE